MNFGGRDQGRRIRPEVGWKQRREKHAGVVRDRLNSGPGVAAEHHNEFDAVLADEFGRTGAGLRRVVFIVVGDEFDHVRFAADVDPAVGVHPFRPDHAAVEAGLSPGRDRTGQGREEADLDDLVGRKGRPGHRRGQGSGAGESRGAADELAAVQGVSEEVGEHLVLPLFCDPSWRSSSVSEPIQYQRMPFAGYSLTKATDRLSQFAIPNCVKKEQDPINSRSSSRNPACQRGGIFAHFLKRGRLVRYWYNSPPFGHRRNG